ncbi:zeta toxin family protein [Streptomyces sp. NPDC101115]|uniref:zeta toxin family protein n=1 Tax=Streptomyces sp. NPDC101115 TaxID=3366106 RepID=UPI00380A9219
MVCENQGGGPGEGLDACTVLSARESQDVLERVILPAATKSAVPQDRPVVVIVGGQPGAGKTKVAGLVQAALGQRGGAVRIGRGLYKHAHRHHVAALTADVRTAGAKVRSNINYWQTAVEVSRRPGLLQLLAGDQVRRPRRERGPAQRRDHLRCRRRPVADAGVARRASAHRARGPFDTRDRVGPVSTDYFP